MTLFTIAFIAGVLTVLAPCILPVLPVVVGGSLDGKGGKVSFRRAMVVTLSLAISVIAFTFLLKVSSLLVDVSQETWGYISGAIIIFFGFVSLFPTLWERIPGMADLSADSNALLGSGYQRKGIWGDIIIGAALGPVFSTCSPTYFVILATVLPVSFALGTLYLTSYVVGLSLSLLLIAYVGQRVIGALGVAADPHGAFKRILGIVFLVVGVAVFTGYDKRIEASILTSGFFDVTTIEQRLLKDTMPPEMPIPVVSPNGVVRQTGTENQPSAASTTSGSIQTRTDRTPPPHYLTLQEKAVLYKRAPELTGIDGYINTNGTPITLADYKGKVVLIDIWTYSCINCQRTLPYVTSWYEKYKDKGFVVIGVHTPEFAFEHVLKNVEDAAQRFGIHYPVVLDNEYATWNAFGNHYWPRKYLIDVDGYIVYDHAGEGEYDAAESAIQKALMERSARMGMDMSGIATTTTNIKTGGIAVGSPETYFGANRNEYLGNGKQGVEGEQYFAEPLSIDLNTLYLIGQWNMTGEYAETSATVGTGNIGSDRIDYLYDSKSLYLVAGTRDAPVTVEVTIDGKPVPSEMRGADISVKDGRTYVTVSDDRLYKIIEGKSMEKHLIEFIVSSPGLQAYTFTFG